MDIVKNVPKPVPQPPTTIDIKGLTKDEALAVAYQLGKNASYGAKLSTYSVFSQLVKALGQEYADFRQARDAEMFYDLPKGFTFV